MNGTTLIVGNVGIDTCVTPDAVRSHPAGTALRCALGACLFGLPVKLISAVGPEPEYDAVFDILRRRGASLDGLQQISQSICFTTTYDRFDCITDFTIAHPEVADKVADLASALDLTGADRIVICPMRFDACGRLLARADARGVSTFLIMHYALFSETPAPRYLEVLPLTDYLVINIDEGRAVSGLQTVEEVGDFLAQRVRQTVFLTLHDKGSAVFSRSGERAYYPAIAPRVQNVLGAGDTCAGGIVAGMHLTGQPVQALTFGLLACALVLAEPDHALLLAAMHPRATITEAG